MSERLEPCPYCGAECSAEYFDNGVGMQQCGPYHCDKCQASEIGRYDANRNLSRREKQFGWYEPHSEPGSSANVINGKIVTSDEVKEVYRDEFIGNERWNDREYVNHFFDELRRTKED